jgi:site-specific DNA-cytosine methylase|uniref:DNA (Cytosine-5)-methyltransferase 3A n=1 Tax=Phage sp. ctR9T2 TaxID=2825795 RepID=A0A8S5UFM7_9VIRU|nr:MAG TPA: DNA (cytosine-5)-methyltransferase 3A [Phage sp. ctR9T2]
MKHLGDITQIHGDRIEPVDVIAFGSPCQDYAEKIVIPRIITNSL